MRAAGILRFKLPKLSVYRSRLAITRQILDDSVNQETGKRRNDFSHLVSSSLRHSIEDACRFRFPRSWLETSLHGSHAQATRVTNQNPSPIAGN